MASPDPTFEPPLSEADSRWLKQLVVGMGWLLAAIVLSLVYTTIVALQSAAITTEVINDVSQNPADLPSDLSEYLPAWMTPTLSIGLAAVSALFLVGSWRTTAPEPGRPNPHPALTTTRITCVPAFAMNIPASLLLLAPGSTTLAIVSLTIKLLAVALLSVGFPASLIYLRHLAQRIPAPRLAKHTAIVFWGQFVAGFVLIGGLVAFAALLIYEVSAGDTIDISPGIFIPFAPGVIALTACFIWWVGLMIAYWARFSDAVKQSHSVID